MSEAIKEPLCTSCIHLEVCAYKQNFLDIIKAIEKVSCYDFISGVYIECKYHQTERLNRNEGEKLKCTQKTIQQQTSLIYLTSI